MILSMIAAIGTNNALGKDNWLLWDLPADMKHFRETTKGHTVIMGRKTFESFPNGPLPNRDNIVVTRDRTYSRPGIAVVHSLDEALRLAALEQGKHFEEKQEDTETFIIGGGELYKEALPRAHKLYITRVDDAPDADTYFPEIGPEWKEIAREEHQPDADHKHAYAFVTYKKTA